MIAPPPSPPTQWQRVAPAGSATSRFRIWRTLTHPILLVLLLIIAALMLWAHLLLPQLPTVLEGQTAGRATWLAATTAAGAATGPFFASLGLFDIAHSLWGNFTLALLALVLVLRLADRLALARATRRLAPPDELRPATAAYELRGETQPDLATAWPLAHPMFHRRNAIAANESATELYIGDRNQRATWVSALFEFGLLLALLAFVLNLRLGWQTDRITLDGDATVRLQPLRDATLTLSANGEEVRLCCNPEQTLSLRNTWPHLTRPYVRGPQTGPALTLTGTSNGEPLSLQAIEQGGNPAASLALRFPETRSERTVAIPDANLFLRITAAGDQQFRVQVLDEQNQELAAREINDQAEINVGDVELVFTPGRFVTFTIVNRPWLWLLTLALLVALAGLVVRLAFPYWRVGIWRNAGGFYARWQGQRRPAAELTELLSPPAT